MGNFLSYLNLKTHYIQKPYDTIADIYAKNHFDEPIFDPLINKFTSYLPEIGYLLDAGCGPGGETKKLLERGFKVTGIDVSLGMLQIARQKVPQGDFRQADLTDLPFEKETFDGIWSARALIHIPEPELEMTLAGFRRVLKPNGVVCLTVLTGTGEGIIPEDYDPEGKTKVYFRYFPENNLEYHLEACDFAVITKTLSYLEPGHEPHLTVFAKKAV